MKLSNLDALGCCKFIEHLYEEFDSWEASGRQREDKFAAPGSIWGESQSYERKPGPRDRYHWVREWAPMARLYYRDTDGTLFIAFRGTATRREWGNDYRFQTRTMDLPFVSGRVPSVGVHDGFADTFESMQGDLMEAIELELTAHTVRRVIITGHSLGGGLATLTMLAVVRRFNIRLITDGAVFGSPRVGGRAFATAFEDSTEPDSFWRYEILGDIVPKLPLQNMGFWSFEPVGNQVLLPVDYGNNRDNHIIPAYIKAIGSGLASE